MVVTLVALLLVGVLVLVVTPRQRVNVLGDVENLGAVGLDLLQGGVEAALEPQTVGDDEVGLDHVGHLGGGGGEVVRVGVDRHEGGRGAAGAGGDLLGDGTERGGGDDEGDVPGGLLGFGARGVGGIGVRTRGQDECGGGDQTDGETRPHVGPPEIVNENLLKTITNSTLTSGFRQPEGSRAGVDKRGAKPPKGGKVAAPPDPPSHQY